MVYSITLYFRMLYSLTVLASYSRTENEWEIEEILCVAWGQVGMGIGGIEIIRQTGEGDEGLESWER